MTTVLPTALIPTYDGRPMRPTPIPVRPATTEFLVPGLLPELPRHLSPRRPSWRMRLAASPVAEEARIWAWIGFACAGPSVAIAASILGGAA